MDAEKEENDFAIITVVGFVLTNFFLYKGKKRNRWKSTTHLPS